MDLAETLRLYNEVIPGPLEHRRAIDPDTLRRLLEPRRKLTAKQRRARDWSAELPHRSGR